MQSTSLLFTLVKCYISPPHLHKDELVLDEYSRQTVVLLNGLLGLRESHQLLVLLKHFHWPRYPPIELSGPSYLARDWGKVTGNRRILLVL